MMQQGRKVIAFAMQKVIDSVMPNNITAALQVVRQKVLRFSFKMGRQLYLSFCLTYILRQCHRARCSTRMTEALSWRHLSLEESSAPRLYRLSCLTALTCWCGNNGADMACSMVPFACIAKWPAPSSPSMEFLAGLTAKRDFVPADVNARTGFMHSKLTD
jgi:hypothetical protein